MQYSATSMAPPSYRESAAHPSTWAGPEETRFFNELSQQLSAVRSHKRPVQQGSTIQRHSNSMRIVKPRSAHQSPCSSRLQSWRRTVPNDAQYSSLSTQQAAEAMCSAPTALGTEPARPLSWHPLTQFDQYPGFQIYGQSQLQPPLQQCMDSPTYEQVDLYASSLDFPSTPAMYSGYTSPASAFSPLPLPYTSFEPQTQQCYTQASWAVPPELSPDAPTLESPANLTEPASVGFATSSWDSFDLPGLGECTAPPTPGDPAQVSHMEPKVRLDENIAYQRPLEDDEEEGEVLYGMGLYDAPAKPMGSRFGSLLGSSLAYPEPTGKGLKLEAAWEPPASDDEDSQAGDDDAEGDEQYD